MLLPVKLILIIAAVYRVAWGIFKVHWGRRYRSGHPLPKELWSAPGLSKVNPAYGSWLIRRSWWRIVFWSLVVVLGAAWVVQDDTMVIGPLEVRLLHASTSPYLDVGEGVTLAMFSMIVYFRTVLSFGVMRPDRPGPGEWDAGEVQSRRAGIALIVTGTAIGVAIVGICAYLTYRLARYGGEPLTLLIAPGLTFLSGPIYQGALGLRRRGRRHLARVLTSPAEVAEPFVLYLRSFVDDADLDVSQRLFGIASLVHFLISGRSEEEQLARAVRRLGPLVAVGTPGERLPYVGADRLYLPAEQWKEPVRALIRRARLVVLAIGPGEGTMWELTECRRLLTPDRLVLLVPLERADYDAFRARARGRAVPPLPAYVPDPRIKGDPMPSRLQAVVRYTEEGKRWSPTFVWLQSETLQIRRLPEFRDKVYVGLLHALRPTVDRLTKLSR